MSMKRFMPVAVGWGLCVVPLVAQTPAEAPDNSIPIDRIVTQAVKNIANRYNLNEEQRRFTEELMRRKVYEFLEEHQREVWPVLRELVKYQLNSQAPDPAVAKRIGSSALPLFEKVKKAIIDGNLEWREILSAQQKEMHDFDLKDMQETFKFIDERLDHWRVGQPNAQGIFPPARKTIPGQPPTPPRPAPGIPTLALQESMNVNMFEERVNAFIEEYGLDEGQIKAARSIQEDIVGQAEKYLAGIRADMNKLAQAKREALYKGEREKVAQLDEQHKKLLEPLQNLFDRMDSRLRTLLTQQQIQRHRQAQAGQKKSAHHKNKDKDKEPSAEPAPPPPAPEKTSDSKEKNADKEKDSGPE